MSEVTYLDAVTGGDPQGYGCLGNYALVESCHCPRNPYASGYGRKIPTRWLVRIDGSDRFRRVYAICFSNCASHYITMKGKMYFIPDHRFPCP